MIVIGVDNGLDGGIVCLHLDGKKIGHYIMPTLGGEGGGKRAYDVAQMCVIINSFRLMAEGNSCGLHVYLEHAQAFPGQGVVSTFSTGYGFGLWQGILGALGVPYTLVRPQAWQKELFEGLDRTDTKRCSAQIASRLYPQVDWRATERSKKPHDGKTDALCIAEYGRRKQSHASTHPNEERVA